MKVTSDRLIRLKRLTRHTKKKTTTTKATTPDQEINLRKQQEKKMRVRQWTPKIHTKKTLQLRLVSTYFKEKKVKMMVLEPTMAGVSNILSKLA